MTKAHTPGPWKWRQSYTKGEPQEIVIHAGAIDICSMLAGDIEDEEADAALIAAAPDLLAALEAQIAPRAKGWRVTDWEMRDEQARAAIAKAKGA